VGDFAPVIVQARADRVRQVIWAGHGPQLLYNLDEAVTAYLGGDEGMDAGGNDTFPLAPLAYIACTGDADVWIQTLAGTAILAGLPGVTGVAPSPAQIAEQIALSGIPLVANSQTLIRVPASTAMPHGVTTFLEAVEVSTQNALSYDVGMELQAGGASTFPFARISLGMLDAASTTYEEDWIVPMLGYTGTPVTSGTGVPQGFGALHAGSLVASCRPLDSVDATMVYFQLDGSARPPPPISTWQDNPQNRVYGTSGYTAPPIGNGFDRVLGAQQNGNIAHGTTIKYLLGLYSGPVIFTFQATGGTAGNITFAVQAVGGTNTLLPLLSGSSGAGAVTGPVQLMFPRAPVILTVTSTEGVTNDGLIWSAIAAGSTQ